MKLILLGLASVICGGIALMPLLVQPDPGSAPLRRRWLGSRPRCWRDSAVAVRR